jgi:NADPH:quinone reductase-like Zn-dependent oxidoreductase
MSTIREFRIHRFGGPEVLRLDEVEPSLPDASQVLVAVNAASVNPVDFKIRNGKYPAVKEDRLPYTLGRDVSGVVEKCGAPATAFKVGDEVFGIVGIGGGGYAEKTVLDEKAIARKPASLDDAHAAAIPLAGQTAWQGLYIARLRVFNRLMCPSVWPLLQPLVNAFVTASRSRRTVRAKRCIA